MSISEDKQNRILSAALEIFAQMGYSKASTNQICEKAQISKGLLFHYFRSKKNLYLLLLDREIKEMGRLYQENFPKKQMDFFDLIVESTKIKLKIGIERPEGYRLIYDAFIHTPKDIEDEIKAQLSGFSNRQENFMKMVDADKFKKGVDVLRATDIIFAYSKGKYDQYVELFKTLTPEEALSKIGEIGEDMFESFCLLKTAFYKDEYL